MAAVSKIYQVCLVLQLEYKIVDIRHARYQQFYMLIAAIQSAKIDKQNCVVCHCLKA